MIESRPLFPLVVLAAVACGERSAPTASDLPTDLPDVPAGFTIVQGDVFVATNGSGAASSRLTIDAPALAAGDLLIAQVVLAGELERDDAVCAPDGWAPILRTELDPPRLIQQTFYYVARQPENATTHTWHFQADAAGCGTATTPRTGLGASGGIIRYTGVDPANPIEAFAGAVANGASGSTTAPGVRTESAGTEVLRFFAAAADGGFASSAAPEIYSIGSSNNAAPRSAASYGTHQRNAGATGAFTATLGGSALWVSQTVALRPAGRIVIEKQTVPAGAAEEFDFTLAGGPADILRQFFLADGGEHDTGFTLAAGTYALRESVPTGWELSAAECDRGDTPDRIMVRAGETVTCRFTNTQLQTPSPPPQPEPPGQPEPPMEPDPPAQPDGLLYLHNDPTPPAGGTAAQPNLPLSTSAPTATTLHNYARDLDGNDGVTGRFLDKAPRGEELSIRDLQKYQTWRTAAQQEQLTIDGSVQLRIRAKMKAPGKNLRLRAYLLECDGGGCSAFATLEMPTLRNAAHDRFQELTLSAEDVRGTIAAGGRLQLRVVMLDIADADPAYLGYDTVDLSARLILP